MHGDVNQYSAEALSLSFECERRNPASIDEWRCAF